jgi:elongator complex protein 2
VPQVTIKGHFGEVTDLDWDPMGMCLVSCSADQTTRLLTNSKIDGLDTGYFEISRPQVHGYDINTVSTLKNLNGELPFKILSGGDEKVIRLFEAPYNFVKTFNCLNQAGHDLRFRSDIDNSKVEELLGEQDEAAKKQPLGLMNKP